MLSNAGSKSKPGKWLSLLALLPMLHECDKRWTGE